MSTEQRVVSASGVINAPADRIFELIADPARQPEWDGNDNLSVAAAGQRPHQVGDVFVMTTTKGSDRANRIVEFEEGRRIAWKPSAVGEPEPGHVWRWELNPNADGTTTVTHTYDWTELDDPKRLDRARWTTSDRLQASIDRLAVTAESE